MDAVFVDVLMDYKFVFHHMRSAIMHCLFFIFCTTVESATLVFEQKGWSIQEVREMQREGERVKEKLRSYHASLYRHQNIGNMNHLYRSVGGLSHANLFEVSLIKRVEGKKMIKNSLG